MLVVVVVVDSLYIKQMSLWLFLLFNVSWCYQSQPTLLDRNHCRNHIAAFEQSPAG
jgi:hypothetical protein